MLDLFDNFWGGKNEIIVDHCVDITLQVRPFGVTSFDFCVFNNFIFKIALSVISVAGSYITCIILSFRLTSYFSLGFGQRISWKDDRAMLPNHKMTFKEALHIVSTDVYLRLLAPDWAMGLTERLKNVRLAFDELEVCSFRAFLELLSQVWGSAQALMYIKENRSDYEVWHIWQLYMLDSIEARRTVEAKTERYDLFTNLIDANNDEDIAGDDPKLSTKELLGSCFFGLPYTIIDCDIQAMFLYFSWLDMRSEKFFYIARAILTWIKQYRQQHIH